VASWALPWAEPIVRIGSNQILAGDDLHQGVEPAKHG
jgi:hypothetical protein